MGSVVYKIRVRGGSNTYWSNGSVCENYAGTGFEVKFSKKGKSWTTMKAVEKHLLTAITKGCFNPNWEVVTIEETTIVPVTDLMTPAMTMGILKHKGDKK